MQFSWFIENFGGGNGEIKGIRQSRDNDPEAANDLTKERYLTFVLLTSSIKLIEIKKEISVLLQSLILNSGLHKIVSHLDYSDTNKHSGHSSLSSLNFHPTVL